MIEMIWHKPDCATCRHNESFFRNFHTLKKIAVRCGARQQAVALNGSFKRLGNCWYYEMKS